jgi:hypothetical protein
MIEVVQAFDRMPIARLESEDRAALDHKIKPPEGCSPTAALG